MAKVIDESKLNYNKYPGEHVMAVGEVVQVGQRTFHIVHNYREAFDAEKLEQRFSDVLDKYDYIVGDWGFEQLRLKGFSQPVVEKCWQTIKLIILKIMSMNIVITVVLILFYGGFGQKMKLLFLRNFLPKRVEARI